MRIALVVWALHSGGAERVVANLADAWVERGHDVTLITLASPETDFYVVDPRVDRLSVGSGKREWAPSMFQISRLRTAIEGCSPDVIVSAISVMNAKTLLATRRLRIPVVVTEHNAPAEQPLPSRWRLMRRLSYPRAAAVVMLTEGAARWARAFIDPDRVWVIPNFVSLPSRAESRRGNKILLSVGRMRRQKGFDLLLRAFASTQARQQGWTLRIVGDGPERDAVEAVAQDLSLDHEVVFAGRTTDIWSEYASADMYVLSSRYEGFPLVLLEAMGSGLPVVAFDCPTGPREIVTNAVDGLLVPREDVGALASAIDRLAGDPELRRHLGSNARGVADRYSADRVLSMWSSLLETVVSERR